MLQRRCTLPARIFRPAPLNLYYRHDRNFTPVRTSLSAEAKQTFQVVALLATICVVAIHYRSVTPHSAVIAEASPNALAQEILIGGLARFAVPMFAFAAGFFYFLSDDGSLGTYFRKLSQRARSVLAPYLVLGFAATVSWLAVRYLEGDTESKSLRDLVLTWLLRPPAEQLWFLRDLMLLVLVAPIVCRIATTKHSMGLIAVATAWAMNCQPFPIVGGPLVQGWYLLNIETLFFFCLGCAAVHRVDWIERLGRIDSLTTTGLVMVWIGLVVARVFVRPNFDCWYVSDYEIASLLLHKLSILTGCMAVWSLSWKLRSPMFCRLSGAAFFVYLIHEFPMRAIVARVFGPLLGKAAYFWVMFPTVTFCCFALAMLLNRYAPRLIALVTSGRTPESAAKLSGASRRFHEVSVQ